MRFALPESSSTACLLAAGLGLGAIVGKSRKRRPTQPNERILRAYFFEASVGAKGCCPGAQNSIATREILPALKIDGGTVIPLVTPSARVGTGVPSVRPNPPAAPAFIAITRANIGQPKPRVNLWAA